MKPAAQIQAAIECLAELDLSTKPADQFMANFFRARRYIGSKDRQAVAEYVYGILRRRSECDHWAAMRNMSPDLLSPDRSARVRMLSYLWQFKKVSRADIGILFSGDRYAPDRLNTKERNLFDVDLPESQAPQWVCGNYPEWLHPYMQRRFGGDVPAHMAAMLEEASGDLRANTLKTSREDLLSLLAQEGIEGEALDLPNAVRLQKRLPVSHLQAFKDGLFEVQDEGSQKIVQLLNAHPGLRVCDLCAGAGGKTMAMAADMQNKGMILATDIADWRLKRAKERMRRAGVNNAQCMVLDDAGDKRLKRLKESFDRVLVDAPCSGTGTWRRNPDQKWRLKKADLDDLMPLQLSLLEKGSRLLKVGGEIVYATCSLLVEENEDVIEAFLANHPQFEKVDSFALTPLEHGVDGFFAAKLVRKS